MQKTSLYFLLIVFPLFTSYFSLAQSETGFADGSQFHVRVDRVCISTLSRNHAPGPYAVKVRLFRSVFDPETASFTKTKEILLDQLGSVLFSDFTQTKSNTKGNSTVQQFQSMNLAPLHGLDLRFEDFEFSFPNQWLVRKMTEVKDLTMTRFSEDFSGSKEKRRDRFYVLGLQLVIEDAKRHSQVTQARIAFAQGADYLSANFREGLERDDAKHLLIWPKAAVLFSKQRDFYVVDGLQSSPEKDQGCDGHDTMSFGISVSESSPT